MANLTERRDEFFDWTNLALASVLFLAPWALDFAGDSAAAWNAWICGALIGLTAFAAIQTVVHWGDWISLALSIWVIASPWVLGFANLDSAFWTHIVLGILILAATAWKAG